jgi:putative ABC transport system substrate-binding protein
MIAPVVPFPVRRTTDIDPEARSLNIYALSQCGCRSSRSDSTHDPRSDHCFAECSHVVYDRRAAAAFWEGSPMPSMRRRDFVSLLGGAAAAWPLVVRAQQSPMPVIGYFGIASPDLFASRLRAFRQGLSESGYVEGRNVAIEYRWAEGHYDRIAALIEDLVRREVTVIAAPGSTPAALAAKAATRTIPVVFVTAADPVAARLVASLNRPGGNLTGVTALALELGPKQLELLREVVPTATVMALLVNPASRVLAETQSRDLQATAHALGLQLHVVHARTASDFDTVFATLGQLRAGGLVIGGEALFTGRSEQLATLALRHAMPAIYQFREFAAAGGLMSYGANLNDAHRLAGLYTGRILGGQKPSDLLVQQSTKLELILNVATAKALGLDVPSSLLARADEVIE